MPGEASPIWQGAPDSVFGPRLLFLIARNTSRTECFSNALNMLFPPPAFRMTAFTIAILILQGLGFVLAVDGLSLCITGKGHIFSSPSLSYWGFLLDGALFSSFIFFSSF